MSEVIQSGESEVTCKEHGQIAVITVNHATYEEFNQGMPAWPREVYDSVAQLAPQLSVLTVDSIDTGYYEPDINQLIPVDNLDVFPSNGGELFVLGADTTGLYRTPRAIDIPENSGYWLEIKKSIIEYDPDFAPGREGGKGINDAIRRGYGVEEAVLTVGLAALTGRIYQRWNENRHAKNVSSVGNDKTGFTRRDFLKLIGVGLPAAFFVFGRKAAFNESMRHVDVAKDSHTALQTITQMTKPILLDVIDPHNQGNIRNAKIGLTTMDMLTPLGLPGVSAAIVLGNAHRLYVYPGQQDEKETLPEAKERLLGYMHRGLKDIVNIIRTGDSAVPTDVLVATLQEIFATYDVYRGQPGKNISWKKIRRNDIPEVADLIVGISNDN